MSFNYCALLKKKKKKKKFIDEERRRRISVINVIASTARSLFNTS
jgi:hypothetical protein